MLLQKCLYAAFPLVTMEKLFTLLSKANSSAYGLHSIPYSRVGHCSSVYLPFPTSSVFHLS